MLQEHTHVSLAVLITGLRFASSTFPGSVELFCPLRLSACDCADICVTVTLLDGLVLARSQFNTDMVILLIAAHAYHLASPTSGKAVFSDFVPMCTGKGAVLLAAARSSIYGSRLDDRVIARDSRCVPTGYSMCQLKVEWVR